MTAQELRIGNWVTANSPEMFIKEISEHTVGLYMPESESDPFLYDIDEIEPIQLSPSVLEACGFEFEDRADHGIFSIVVGEVGVYNVWHSPFGFGVQNDNASINRELKSLHQLQNHFYETTGQELIYNPTTK
jgi:hypothetical protein